MSRSPAEFRPKMGSADAGEPSAFPSPMGLKITTTSGGLIRTDSAALDRLGKHSPRPLYSMLPDQLTCVRKTGRATLFFVDGASARALPAKFVMAVIDGLLFATFRAGWRTVLWLAPRLGLVSSIHRLS